MAAPHVAGIIAGLMTSRSELSSADLKYRVIKGYQNSKEVINFNRALNYLDNDWEEEKVVQELGSSDGNGEGPLQKMGGGCARVDIDPNANNNLFFSFVLNYLIFIVLRRVRKTINWERLV